MMILVKIILCFLAFELVEIFCARDPLMVTVPEQGVVMGVYLKMFRTQTIIGYLGLPYAAPPLGINRFAPPVVDDLPKWDVVRNASQLQPDCLQPQKKDYKKHEQLFMNLLQSHRDSDDEGPRPMDEDCLYLNIYSPEGPAPMDGWPIIVWLHSGDFQVGSPSNLDPFQLVIKQKVMVITVAYRLNIFGFFTTMDGEAPGNFGLMDQSAALFWIQKNIKLFNGNEKSVTLMGQGAGAVSVVLHLTSGDWSDDGFHKAIVMSASSMFETAVRDTKSYSYAVDQTSSAFGCDRTPTSKLIVCLRMLPVQLLADFGLAGDWGPIMDAGLSKTTTPFIQDYPKNLIERGMIRNVSLLIGFTDMEDALDIQMGFIMDDGVSEEMFQTLIEDVALNDLQALESNETCGSNSKLVLDAVNFVYKPYPPTADTSELRRKYIDYNNERKYIAPIFYLASQMSKSNQVFVYRFDIKPQTPAATDGLPDWVTVVHRYDLIFVWGFPYWSKLKNTTAWHKDDKRVTDLVMLLWMNFAKYTNPSHSGIYINWAPFTPKHHKALIVDRSFNMSDSSSLHYPGIKFWNEYYEEVITFAMQCCNDTSSASQLFNLFSFKVDFNKSPIVSLTKPTAQTLVKYAVNIFTVAAFIIISHANNFLT